MRRWFFAFGCVVLAAAWLGPLPSLARNTFSAHMSMHMLVVAVAAPLLALGIAGGRFDPVPSRSRLFAPIPASFIELVIVWVWHGPALHHAARSHTLVFCTEQATFLAGGLLLWLSVLGGGRSRTPNRTGAGIVALLLTSMHMTLLGALLALSPRPLYSHMGVMTSIAPIDDQHLGGAIMLVAGGASYLLGGLCLTVGLLRGAARTSMERT
jgi:putative membrane protein